MVENRTISEVYESLKQVDESKHGSSFVSVYKKGPSLLIVYCPHEKYDEVVRVLERCNSRVTHEIERDRDMVIRICMGRHNKGSIYANNYQKREGQPIDTGAEELFDEMMN